MARIQNGILDGFRGRVGPVIGSSWKGRAVMRAKSRQNKNRKFSQAQLAQQAKFSVGRIYLQQLTPLLNITFGNYARDITAGNTAFSHILREAITGVFPDFTIDWPRLMVCKGALPLPVNAVAVAEAGKINYTWQAETAATITGDLPTDRSVLVVICPNLQQATYTTLGPMRSTGAASIDVKHFAGNDVHTYFAFISEDGKKATKSVYTGMKAIS